MKNIISNGTLTLVLIAGVALAATAGRGALDPARWLFRRHLEPDRASG
jgi:hypothetical protein